MLTLLLYVNLHHQERIARIDSEVQEEEYRQRQEAEDKKAQIEKAEKRRKEGTAEDESQLVDDIFNFIHDQPTDSSLEGSAPAAFKVRLQGRNVQVRLLSVKNGSQGTAMVINSKKKQNEKVNHLNKITCIRLQCLCSQISYTGFKLYSPLNIWIWDFKQIYYYYYYYQIIVQDKVVGNIHLSCLI